MEILSEGHSLAELICERGTGFLGKSSEVRQSIEQFLPATLERVEDCFGAIKRKYYAEAGPVAFDPWHGDHMASLLWFLANTIHMATSDTWLPTAISYMNRSMHSVDLFYNVDMPRVFLLVHPLGSVVGRGEFGNGLVVYQNVTIGAIGNDYPTLGEGVILYPGSRVIGASKIGNNCVLAPGAQVVNQEVPCDSIVFGSSPDLEIRRNSTSVSWRAFGSESAW